MSRASPKVKPRAPLAIGSDHLRDDVAACDLGDQSRMFFESVDLCWNAVRKHSRKLPGLSVEGEWYQGGKGSSPCWKLTFLFEERQFQIDTNHHAANSLFWVDSPGCPDRVLLQVLNHFNALTPLRFDDPLWQPPPPVKLFGATFAVVLGIAMVVAFIFVLAMTARQAT